MLKKHPQQWRPTMEWTDVVRCVAILAIWLHALSTLLLPKTVLPDPPGSLLLLIEILLIEMGRRKQTRRTRQVLHRNVNSCRIVSNWSGRFLLDLSLWMVAADRLILTDSHKYDQRQLVTALQVNVLPTKARLSLISTVMITLTGDHYIAVQHWFYDICFQTQCKTHILEFI